MEKPGTSKSDSASDQNWSFKFDSSLIRKPMVIRNDDLESIQGALKTATSSGARIAILAGKPGSGKSTLVRMYLKEQREKQRTYKSMTWIEEDSDTEYKFQATALNSDVEPTPTLTVTKPNSVTLIVFENVQDPEIVKKYLERIETSSAEILITTSNEGCWGDFPADTVVPVGPLEKKSCVEYIENQLESSGIEGLEEDFEALASNFGYLAIGVQSAVSSIISRKTSLEPITVQQFVDTFQKHQVPGYAKNEKQIEQLWTENLRYIAETKNGEVAIRILYIVAYLAPSQVPVNWIPVLCGTLIQKFEQVDQALSILESLSMAQRTADNNIIVHRLLCKTLLARLQSTQNNVLEWMLPAVQNLYLELRRRQDLKLFMVTLVTLLDRLKRESHTTHIISFYTYFGKQRIPGCNQYLDELALKILTQQCSAKLQILQQLINNNVQAELLIFVYTEQLFDEYKDSSSKCFVEMCEFVNSLPPACFNPESENCEKFVNVVSQAYRIALDNQTLEAISEDHKTEPKVLLKPLLTSLLALWNRNKTKLADVESPGTLASIAEVIAGLVKTMGSIDQDPETTVLILEISMMWYWLVENSKHKTKIGTHRTKIQRLLTKVLQVREAQVETFRKLLLPFNESKNQMDFKGHWLAAVVNLTKSSHACSSECKVLESLFQFGAVLHKNFPTCLLPFAVLYYCLETHYEMLQTASRNHLEKLERCAKKVIFGTKCAFPIIATGAPSTESTSFDMDILSALRSLGNEFLDLLPDSQAVFAWPKFNENSVEENAIPANTQEGFQLFPELLKLQLDSKEMSVGEILDLLKLAHFTYFKALKESQELTGQTCIHTSQHFSHFPRGSGREALSFVEAVFDHVTLCCKDKLQVLNFVFKLWFFTPQDYNDDLRKLCVKLLMKSVDPTDSSANDTSERSVFSFVQRANVINHLLFIGAVDETVGLFCEMVALWKRFPSTIATLDNYKPFSQNFIFITHALLLRNDIKTLKPLIAKCKQALSCSGQDWQIYLLRTLECVFSAEAREEMNDLIDFTCKLQLKFVINTVRIDLWWSKHLVAWLQESNKCPQDLFDDQKWISNCYVLFGVNEPCIPGEVMDCVLYYQTIEVALFGNEKEIERAFQKAAEKIKQESLSNPGIDGMLTWCLSFQLIQEYRRGKLWFQQVDDRKEPCWRHGFVF